MTKSLRKTFLRFIMMHDNLPWPADADASGPSSTSSKPETTGEPERKKRRTENDAAGVASAGLR